MLTHIFSHLPPPSLSDVSLVSKRFHELVTTPHAWRIAFSRFFPGVEALNVLGSNSEPSDEGDSLRAERRFFTRLTALASWRSEYILRTRLLRSLARGKPAELIEQSGPGHSRPNAGNNAGNTGNSQITYSSNLVSTVNHLHANFGTALNKKPPRFIHGTDDLGSASTSDPRFGKIDSWGFSNTLGFRQFADVFPGDAQYGLGAGDVVGVPNVMDVSQAYGMIYGEGIMGGVLCYRSLEERRGRDLLWSSGASVPECGIPCLMNTDAICAVWIAKNSMLPELSEGLIGILSGSSTGVLTAYSLGTKGIGDRRFERGEITARWVLSPGVPIVAIVVDENLSSKRHLQRRIWAVVLNALGELYYLTEVPKQSDPDQMLLPDRTSELAQQYLEKLAWATGRTVYWTMVEPTRRIARVDPFNRSDMDGSYSPRSSSNQMLLNHQQLAAETTEIETFLQKKPSYFRKVCDGWDMRRRLEVDFVASDEDGAGEGIVVIRCGLEGGQTAEIKRFTRCKLRDASPESMRNPILRGSTAIDEHTSIFGDHSAVPVEQTDWSFATTTPTRRGFSPQPQAGDEGPLVEEWRTSIFLFGGLKAPQISTSAIDNSSYALLTTMEDPLLSMTGSSMASSPASSPLGHMSLPTSSSDVPGHCARLLAVGTKTGTIVLWDMRAPTATNTIIENSVKPIRIIYTDSPQISCLALTALYLVHGGNDGLVQAWDPLASNTDPIRTLNSRFSSRARRRLVQAEASPAGVGINLFAAGAICLDPDPTALRGMVSLGSHLRYWSYSSLAADRYKGNKRRLRRSERGSNQGGDRFSGTGRGALKEYIANEKFELEREKSNKRKEKERLAGRFGVDLLGPGASESEILAYATMLSEEAARSDELRRKSTSDASSSDTITEEAVASPESSDQGDDNADDEMAEAIRLSLQENSHYGAAYSEVLATGSPSFPIKYAKKKSLPSSSPRTPAATASNSKRLPSDTDGIPSGAAGDLEYVLQLSLAEEESRAYELGDVASEKGKGRAL